MGSVAGAVLLSLWAGLARGASSSAAYVVRVTLCACLAAGCLSSGAVEAATTDGQTSVENSTDKRLWTVGIRWENDTIANHDRFYTNGSAVWLAHTGESWADPIMNWLPWGQGRHTVTYSLSQAMFTPEDTARAVPDPTDRPYAGVLTFGLGLHVDRDNRYNGLKLILGVVGPWALGGGDAARVPPPRRLQHPAGLGLPVAQRTDYQPGVRTSQEIPRPGPGRRMGGGSHSRRRAHGG